MVRYSILFFIFGAFPATAHVGHVGELAGHDHVVIGAAIGAAVIAGLIGALKGEDEADDTDEDTPELQEA